MRLTGNSEQALQEAAGWARCRVRTLGTWLGLVLLTSVLAVPDAHAVIYRSFTARYSTNANGDIAHIGNNVLSCGPAGNNMGNGNTCSATLTGTSGSSLGSYGHNGAAGNVAVNVNVDPNAAALGLFNSTSADLNMPVGSTVLWAGLYWGANSNNAQRNQMLFRTPGSSGYTSITANQLDTSGADPYAGFRDVTSLVQAAGNGTYWGANVQTTTGGTFDWGGWALVVVYSNNALPLRNLVIYDGFALVQGTGVDGVIIPVSGFLTPFSGSVSTRVGSIGYDGDRSTGQYEGDNLQVASPASTGVGTTIFDANNPANNFYNSTISELGTMVTSRNPAHNNTYGFDIDRFNLAPGIVPNGATSARLDFVTNGEAYYPHVITWATDIYVPIVTPNVVKTLTDINGGSLLPGDTMRWNISLGNTGIDSATGVVLTDAIPANTTYVPGSLKIVTTPAGLPAAPAVGDYSDAANTAGGAAPTSAEDVADYITDAVACSPAAAPCVRFRIGRGASNVAGGLLNLGDSTSISFDTILNDGLSGRPPAPPGGTLITNSAFIAYSGQTIQTQFGTTSSAATGSSASPPRIAKSFSPASIAVTGTSTLTIVVSNDASNPETLGGVAFADTYPAGMVNANPANPAISCTAGSIAGTLTGGANDGNTIGMNPGATLAPGGSCTITVSVKYNSSVPGAPTAPANLNNVTNPVTSANGGTGTSGAAVLGVGQLIIAKSFSPGAIQASFNTAPGNVPPSGTTGTNTPTSTMSIAIFNPNPAPVTQVAFADTYPTGLLNAATPAVGFSNCGSATNTPAIPINRTVGTSGMIVTAANAVTIPANQTCTITVNVGSTVTSGAQIYNNQTDGARYAGNTLAGSRSNVAPLTVIGPATITKSFNPASVAASGLSQMTIVVTNPNTTTTLTGNATTAILSDTFPAGATGMSVPAGTGNRTINCTAGSSATSGNITTAVTAGSMVLAPGGSCTLNITVTAGATAGSNPNNTATVQWTNAPPSSASATLNITNIASPTFAKVFTPSTIPVGGLSTMSFVITAGAGITNGVSFTDTLPGGMAMTLPATTIRGSCTSGGFNGVTSSPSVTSLALTGLTIAANATCTITVPGVTVTTVGGHLNTTSQLTTTNAGTAAAATANLIGVIPPVISKAFSPSAVALSTASVLSITVSNPSFNAATLTGVVFTDNYPLNLVNTATPSPLATCTPGSSLVGTLTATAGGTQVAVTGAGLTILVGGQCVITVNVQSASAGTYTNTIDTSAGVGAAGVRVTSANGGTGNATSAVLTVGLLGVSKAFAPTTIGAGGTSTVTLTLSNPQGAPVALTNLSDTFPAGMTLTSPVVGGTCAGVTTSPAAGAGASSITFNAGTVPATSTCTITFQVSTAVPGGNLNTSSGVTSAAGTGAPSNTATLQVLPSPSVSKSFSPSVVGQGGVSTMTVTILNTSVNAASSGALVDNYPSGMVNANPSNISTTCNGVPLSAAPTLTATPGAGSFSATSLYFPGNGSCILTVRVTAATAGAYVNTIAAGDLTSTGGSNGSATSATLTVLLPPVVSKTFTPPAVAASGTSTLIITLTNPNATAITGASFTDTYPGVAGIYTNSTPANGSTTCAGGVVSATNGGGSVALTGGTIPANGSCTVSVNVTATATTGSFNNTILAGGVTTTNAGSNAAAATSALAVGRPFVTKSFSPSAVVPGGRATLSFTITNPNNAPITTVGLVDVLPTLPAAMTAVSVGTNTCGGSVSIAPTTTITLSGGSIATSGSCVFNVVVQAGGTSGTAVNVTNAVTSSIGTGSVATASLNVMAAPTAAKSFSPAIVGAGSPSVLTITLSNPNSSPITGGAFTDAYPSVNSIPLTNTATPAGSTTCSGGAVSAANGGTSLVLTGATIPASGSCTVTVNVQAATAGAFVNSTGTITSSNAPNGTAASGTLTVQIPLTVVKTFTPSTVTRGTASTLSITVRNLNANPVTGISLTDVYPAGLINTASANGVISAGAGILAANCTTGSTLGAVANDNQLSFTGTIAANSTCVLRVNVTSNIDGVYLNSTGVTVTGNAGNTASTSGTLVVSGAGAANVPVVVSKSFTPSTIAAGGVSTLSISIFNPNAVAVTRTGIVVTDTYPSGVTNTAVTAGALIGAGCVAPSRPAANNGPSFTLGAAAVATTIPAGGTCTYEIRVTAPVAGTYVNSTGNVTFDTAGTSATPGGAQLLVLAPPAISKSFTPSTVAGAGTATSMSVTITNPNSVPITGLSLTDTYPTNLIHTTTPNLINTCTGTATANANPTNPGVLTLTGGVVPALGSCTLTVNVQATSAAVNLTNTVATSSVTTTNAGSPIAPASATLSFTGGAQPPVSIAKSFLTNPVTAGATTTMRIVFTKNSAAASGAVTAITLADQFPSGLVMAGVATAGAWTGTCNGATVAAIRNIANSAQAVAANNTGFVLTAAGTLPNFVNANPPATTCVLALPVSAASAGTFVNATNAVTASTGTGNNATATLTVVSNPVPIIAKAFSPASVTIGQTSTLTFTLQNPGSVALTALAFTDTMPAGLRVDSPSGAINNCGGTLTAAPGSNVISLAAGALGPGSIASPDTCTISVNVQAIGSGTLDNVTGSVTANNGGAITGNFAVATLAAAAPAPAGVEISKAFTPATITAGGVSTMSFVLSNLNASVATSGVVVMFSDPMTNMRVTTSGTVVNGCANSTLEFLGGNGTWTSGAGAQNGAIGVRLRGNGATGPGTIVPARSGATPGTCTISVQVTSDTPGVLPNSTTPVTANVVTVGVTGSPSNVANLTVTAAAPSIAKAFLIPSIPLGSVTRMRFTITNPNAIPLTGLSFTDGLTSMELAATPNVGGTCTGVSTTASGGATSFTVTSGNLPAGPGASCTVEVDVTSFNISPALGWPNVASGVTTTQTSVAGSQSNVAYLIVTASGVNVSGNVYHDVNDNGARDTAGTPETWATGVSLFVNLVGTGGLVVQSLPLAAGAGDYTFPGVLPGNYQIVITNSAINAAPVVPTGWFFRTPAGGSYTAVTVTTVASPNWNFGLRAGAQVSGKVFRDTGGGSAIANNGVLEATEVPVNPQSPLAVQGQGISGVTVRLTDCLSPGNLYATTTTDVNGDYRFATPTPLPATLCVIQTNGNGFISTGGSAGATQLITDTPNNVSGTTYLYCRTAAGTNCSARPADSISFVPVANTAYQNLNFGDVPANQFVANGSKQAPPGSAVFYPHIFTPGSVGSVTFTPAGVASPSMTGWGQVIYRDNNCDGALSAAEAAVPIGGTASSGATVLADPNDTAATDPNGRRICILLRESVPPAAPFGAQNVVTVTANFTYTNSLPLLATTLTVVDTTLSGSATGGDGLRLTKEVCNVSNPAVNPGGLGCDAATGAGFGTNNSGAPGQELQYRILYTNASSENLGTLVINDTTPPFTQRAATLAAFVSTPTPALTTGALTQPGSGQQGAFVWRFNGTLNPGASGIVSFNVTIQ